MFEKFKNFGYRRYIKFRYKFNKIIVKKKSRHIELDEIVSDLYDIGIKQGDIILVHSSLKSIGYVKGGPNTVINALLKIIGPEGTLVIPTFPLHNTMYELCTMKDYIFDYKTTPTGLGAIPSEFLKYNGIYRSIHPTHSISAIGKYAKKITETHHIGNKTYGENSPWAKLIELNGKILGIGISLAWTTQYHHVEDIMGDNFPVKVKVDDIFNIKCKLDNEEIINVAVQPLDQEVAKTRIEKNPFINNYFWEIYNRLDILNLGKIGEAHSWWVDAKKFCEILMVLAKLGITIYSTEEEIKSKGLYPFETIKNQLNIESDN
ncbi:MAG: AAC(3) family N-acetyltransferase [Promethearchaeota archaeon]